MDFEENIQPRLDPAGRAGRFGIGDGQLEVCRVSKVAESLQD